MAFGLEASENGRQHQGRLGNQRAFGSFFIISPSLRSATVLRTGVQRNHHRCPPSSLNDGHGEASGKHGRSHSRPTPPMRWPGPGGWQQKASLWRALTRQSPRSSG
jgi:hypothetical protein